MPDIEHHAARAESTTGPDDADIHGSDGYRGSDNALGRRGGDELHGYRAKGTKLRCAYQPNVGTQRDTATDSDIARASRLGVERFAACKVLENGRTSKRSRSNGLAKCI